MKKLYICLMIVLCSIKGFSQFSEYGGTYYDYQSGQTGVIVTNYNPQPNFNNIGAQMDAQMAANAAAAASHIPVQPVIPPPTGGTTGSTPPKPTVPPPTPKPDPCAEVIKQSFNALIQQGKLAEILSKFIGANPKYNINISTGPIANGNLASTNQFNITFNQDYPNATVASKTASLIHEYIHAYFNTLYEEYKVTKNSHIYDGYPFLYTAFVNGTGDKEIAHHNQIASSFIDTMAAVIKQLQPGIVVDGDANRFYTDMAWGTLQGTPAFNTTNLKPEDIDRIASRRIMERDNQPRGANTPQGKPCNK
ncbi:hypothetical protein FLAT13_01003 [Flavobacterium salmonis]|uniref:SprT-like family protein n=2 Tax=Flavobacterium salmonis TaxID=2654844 RepID=A0A6V6YRX7_9FLAO|nr:hypothetical protein FLAT13_01003 [Flavobacterium salmonis]